MCICEALTSPPKEVCPEFLVTLCLRSLLTSQGVSLPRHAYNPILQPAALVYETKLQS